MFTATHRASFTVVVGQDANGKDITENRYVTREVSWPTTLDELLTVTGADEEITVGYIGADEKTPGKRVYLTVPHACAMYIEGEKLRLNSLMRPKAADAGVTLDNVKDYDAAYPNEFVLAFWDKVNAKTKKEMKDKILKWLATR